MKYQTESGTNADLASPTPAAAYVRMSTEHQQYSTENQLDTIRLYAAAHSLEIIKTYPGFLMRPAGVAGEASVYQQPAFHR